MARGRGFRDRTDNPNHYAGIVSRDNLVGPRLRTCAVYLTVPEHRAAFVFVSQAASNAELDGSRFVAGPAIQIDVK
jgi:hypothetical protein